MAETAQLTSLLPNQLLARLEALRLGGSRRFTDRSRGEHLSGRGGQSTEFADYRDYQPGDDIRYVDWNIFSRLQRPYLKIFQQEEELHLAILIDASSSMMMHGKLGRACQLAACFGLPSLYGGERVSIHVVGGDDGEAVRFKPCRGRGSLTRLFGFLENLTGGGSLPLEAGVESMLKHHRGKGVALILSDFLTAGDLDAAGNRLHAAGLEQFAIQILAAPERDPSLDGDLRLVDTETDAVLDVSGAGGLLDLYREHLVAFQTRLSETVSNRGGRFLCVDPDEDLSNLVHDSFLRRGWLI